MRFQPRQGSVGSSRPPVILGEEELVKAVDVNKRFGALDVLRGVSCTVRKGEVVVLIGPSGVIWMEPPPLVVRALGAH